MKLTVVERNAIAGEKTIAEITDLCVGHELEIKGLGGADSPAPVRLVRDAADHLTLYLWIDIAPVPSAPAA